MPQFTEKDNSLSFQVSIKPNSKENKLLIGEEVIIYVKSAPVKGKANKELIKILSKEWNVSKNQIHIISGQKSRTKLIKIIDLSNQQKNKITTYMNQ